MKPALWPLLALYVALPSFAAELPGGGIRDANLSRHLEALASDAFEGRAPVTPGEDKTVAYLSAEFARAGLQPAGDEGGWTQAVRMMRTQASDVSVTLHSGGRDRPLAQGEDVVIHTLRPVDHVHVEHAPLVFVGYGIDAPELGWNDYAGIDLHGKIAVMLVNDPDFETAQPGKFNGRALTYYGRWTYKYEEAARKGAAGVLLVHETAPASYGWITVRNSGVGPQLDIERDGATPEHVGFRGWLQRDQAVSLFRETGLDFEAEKKKAQQASYRPLVLKDATMSADFAVEHAPIVSRNVAGLLPGATHPEQTVIVSAHWDGYGVGIPDADGDRIYNAAVDNATGVASVIELARVLAAGEPPARSILFLATTAEERGLLGAKYYAAHPLRPLDTTAAVLNMEMWSPDGPTRDVSIWGDGKVSLQQDLAAAAAVDGRVVSPDPDLSMGLFYRADHFAFARQGVPGITVGAGMDQVDGGSEGGKAERAEYFATKYHQPNDEFGEAWDMRGPTADTLTMYRLIHAIANSESWPTWNEDSEFRGVRLKSSSARE